MGLAAVLRSRSTGAVRLEPRQQNSLRSAAIVILITRSPAAALARNAEPLCRIQMLRRVTSNPSIVICENSRLVAVGDQSVTIMDPAGHTTELPAAMLLLAHGFTPNNDLLSQLKSRGMHAVAIGDANRVARIGDAVRDAYRGVMYLQQTLDVPDTIAC